jgi:hypothetical protein
LQNAIEKRCIICRLFLVCQFLAAWRRSMSKLAWPAAFTCPAAIGDCPRFATSGYQQRAPGRSLGKYQSREPRRFIATADSQRFAAYAARSPDVSAARHPCAAAIGRQKRFAATGAGRGSTANSDRRTFGAIGSRQELATACHCQRRAGTGHHKRLAVNGERRRSTANSDRRTSGTIGSREELATARHCQRRVVTGR